MSIPELGDMMAAITRAGDDPSNYAFAGQHFHAGLNRAIRMSLRPLIDDLRYSRLSNS